MVYSIYVLPPKPIDLIGVAGTIIMKDVYDDRDRHYDSKHWAIKLNPQNPMLQWREAKSRMLIWNWTLISFVKITILIMPLRPCVDSDRYFTDDMLTIVFNWVINQYAEIRGNPLHRIAILVLQLVLIYLCAQERLITLSNTLSFHLSK